MSLDSGLSSSNPNKTCKTSFHGRNDSGELDVFDAHRYFSAASVQEDQSPGVQRVARMRLDMPILRNPIHPSIDLAVDQNHSSLKANQKYKQPRSPGARLASFLNSLFNQTSWKKKKKKSKSGSGGSAKNLEEEGGRRKRRSSISHFGITTDTTSAANAITPTKSYREFGHFSDHHQKVQISVPKNGGNAEKRSTDCARKADEKSRFSNGNVSFKNGSLGFSDRNSNTNWIDEETKFRKFSDFDDGADTDSSSDLFDLPNLELDFYSNGLPVYGTTQMDRIRILAPISSVATV